MFLPLSKQSAFGLHFSSVRTGPESVRKIRFGSCCLVIAVHIGRPCCSMRGIYTNLFAVIQLPPAGSKLTATTPQPALCVLCGAQQHTGPNRRYHAFCGGNSTTSSTWREVLSRRRPRPAAGTMPAAVTAEPSPMACGSASLNVPAARGGDDGVATASHAAAGATREVIQHGPLECECHAYVHL